MRPKLVSCLLFVQSAFHAERSLAMLTVYDQFEKRFLDLFIEWSETWQETLAGLVATKAEGLNIIFN